jgi:hypothetical protein
MKKAATWTEGTAQQLVSDEEVFLTTHRLKAKKR